MTAREMSPVDVVKEMNAKIAEVYAMSRPELLSDFKILCQRALASNEVEVRALALCACALLGIPLKAELPQ